MLAVIPYGNVSDAVWLVAILAVIILGSVLGRFSLKNLLIWMFVTMLVVAAAARLSVVLSSICGYGVPC